MTTLHRHLTKIDYCGMESVLQVGYIPSAGPTRQCPGAAKAHLLSYGMSQSRFPKVTTQLFLSFNMPVAAHRFPQKPILRVPRALSRGKSGQGGEDDYSHPPRGEFKDAWIHTSLPHVITGRMGTTSRDSVGANVR